MEYLLSSSAPLIRAHNLGLEIAGRQLLRDISLELHPAEIVTIIGPNGAGKTTLLRLLLDLSRPTTGSVERLPGLRLGYMPQRLQIDATMPMTVGRFLQLGIDNVNVEHALTRVAAPHLETARLADLSGGEMQRVLLARAAARKPQLLVLDEPTQGVDLGGQSEVYQLIDQLRKELGCGVLLVSHDLHLVMAATDRVLCLNQHICCHGHPEQVSKDPIYLEMFGDKLAPYTHHHNHHHDLNGEVVDEHCDHDHDHAVTPPPSRSTSRDSGEQG